MPSIAAAPRCCFRRFMVSSSPETFLNGSSKIACRSAFNCRFTSTSGGPMSGESKAVVLLSGGLDSYTAAAIAREMGFQIHALTVKYGQRHSHEILAARKVAAALSVRAHREIAV